jgi:dihydroorotate dehydrogenase
MKLRGIEFGNVLCGSGARGFYGEGYWYHKPLRPLGLNFDGSTFVSKTVTLLPHGGNLPLNQGTWTPKELFPKCIKINPLSGKVRNWVSLSNPGIGNIIGMWQWQKMTKPFLISVASLANTLDKRLDEMKRIIDIIKLSQCTFSIPFGLQINFSCPAVEHNRNSIVNETIRMLDIAKTLHMPLMPKYSINSATIEELLEINDHPSCDAVCLSNSIKAGYVGLSGAPLRLMVCERIEKLRDAGFTKPINGGGGILCCKDVDRYYQAGASSVFVASVAMLRPWRIKGIIKHANSLDWSEKNDYRTVS